MSGAAASSVAASLSMEEIEAASQAIDDSVAANMLMEEIEAEIEAEAASLIVEGAQIQAASQPIEETEAQTVSQPATVEIGYSEILLPIRLQLQQLNTTMSKMLVLQKDQTETNYFMEERQSD